MRCTSTCAHRSQRFSPRGSATVGRVRGDDTQRLDDSAIRMDATGGDASVRVVSGVNEGAACPLTRNGALLGRGRMAAQLAEDEGGGAVAELLFDDPWVSRRHAQLHEQGGSWWITDLGSRNRAFVDGAALSEGRTMALGDGALIRLGETLLVFRVHPQGEREARAGRSSLRRPRGWMLSTGWPVVQQVHGDAGFPGFPGCAPSAREVRQRMAQLARVRGHVLVLGETGTGKERVARALGDPDRPFVPQNCAELTRELARSELFGHVRGAFSGAMSAKSGLVEAAERGVLFLDELGELTLDVQAELLRFLEDGSYRPVGSTELRRSGARVVAATNVDLEAAVRAGRFRMDLLARLRASNPPLLLPPLRERREDILDWAAHFFGEAVGEMAAERSAEAGGATATAPTTSVGPRNAGTAECLLLYPWPGNLRELRGVMRGMAAAGLSPSMRPELLPRELREHRRALRTAGEALSAPGAPGRNAPLEEGVSANGNALAIAFAVAVDDDAKSHTLPHPTDAAEAMNAAEAAEAKHAAPTEAASERTSEAEGDPGNAAREARALVALSSADVEAALAETSGSVRAAAHRLGIDRRKLYRLCEKLGIDLDRYRSSPKKEESDE
jgi:DNA-binding NtrC family response regulator